VSNRSDEARRHRRATRPRLIRSREKELGLGTTTVNSLDVTPR
jgi:hypothetical protein